MLDEKQIKSLQAYFGFAKKKHALFVGMKMEEMLSRKKARYLLLLPDCTEKKAEELSHYQKDFPELNIYHYKGNFDVKGLVGYELLNALCITDDHLGNAIFDTLRQEKE